MAKEITVQFYSTDEVEQTSGVEIQTRSRIKFSFNTPFPIASGGCYLEVKFPKQFPLTDEAYTYIPEMYTVLHGDELLMLTEGSPDVKQVYNDHQAYVLNDATSNRIVFRGCIKHFEVDEGDLDNEAALP